MTEEEKFPFEKEITPAPDAAPPAPEVGKALASIKATEHGLLRGGTFEDQFRLAKAYHASRLMPQTLDTPEKILVALQLCFEMNLPPMMNIGKITVINGVPSIYGELPLALVLRSGLLESIKEVIYDKDMNVISAENKNLAAELYGGTCTVKRKGHDPIIRSFTKDDAIRAGIWGKKVWAVYPKRMMQMRPRSWALKDMFPDVLMGISILEYDHNTVYEDISEVCVKSTSIAGELNDEFLKEETTNLENAL